MFIPIIQGATRPGSRGALVSLLVEKVIKENFQQITPKIISPNDFELKFDDDHDPNYSEITKKADAYIVVVSEYNHGYPGKLKTLLDSEFENYKDKPVLIVALSNGQYGGARASVQIAEVLRTLNMIVVKADVLISKVNNHFDENGNFLNTDLINYIQKGINELIRIKSLTSTH